MSMCMSTAQAGTKSVPRGSIVNSHINDVLRAAAPLTRAQSEKLIIDYFLVSTNFQCISVPIGSVCMVD